VSKARRGEETDKKKARKQKQLRKQKSLRFECETTWNNECAHKILTRNGSEKRKKSSPRSRDVSDLCHDNFGRWSAVTIFGLVNDNRRGRFVSLFALNRLYRDVRHSNIRELNAVHVILILNDFHFRRISWCGRCITAAIVKAGKAFSVRRINDFYRFLRDILLHQWLHDALLLLLKLRRRRRRLAAEIGESIRAITICLTFHTGHLSLLLIKQHGFVANAFRGTSFVCPKSSRTFFFISLPKEIIY
jgi:hypothetical protein